MDDEHPKIPPGRETIAEGPWAGWRLWSRDPFELHAGPFHSRTDEDGAVVCAFRAEARHMNGDGAVHGGALMTFADYALFALAGEGLDGPAVTVALNGEFLSAAPEGALVEARGEVTRAGGSLVFVRGTVATAGRALMTFSGIVKRVKAPREPGDGARPPAHRRK